MKLSQKEKEALFQLYKFGCAINALEKLEWDMVSFDEEEPGDGWSARYTSAAQEERLIRRAEYRSDLLNVEMIAFQKGIDAAVRWLEEHK